MSYFQCSFILHLFRFVNTSILFQYVPFTLDYCYDLVFSHTSFNILYCHKLQAIVRPLYFNTSYYIFHLFHEFTLFAQSLPHFLLFLLFIQNSIYFHAIFQASCCVLYFFRIPVIFLLFFTIHIILFISTVFWSFSYNFPPFMLSFPYGSEFPLPCYSLAQPSSSASRHTSLGWLECSRAPAFPITRWTIHLTTSLCRLCPGSLYFAIPFLLLCLIYSPECFYVYAGFAITISYYLPYSLTLHYSFIFSYSFAFPYSFTFIHSFVFPYSFTFP